MIDEKILQDEKLDDEELEKVSGGYGGHAAGGISSDPFACKKNWFYNGEEPKNTSRNIFNDPRFNAEGGH